MMGFDRFSVQSIFTWDTLILHLSIGTQKKKKKKREETRKKKKEIEDAARVAGKFYDDFWIRDVACCNWWDSLTKEYLNEINKKLKYDR